MMRKIATGLGASLVAALLSLSPAMAEENHKAEAAKHAQAAVEAGKKGDAAAVGEHCAMAKTHADAAQQEKANPHLGAGIENLNKCIEHAGMGHADIAGGAAEAAVSHLQAAEKSF